MYSHILLRKYRIEKKTTTTKNNKEQGTYLQT